MSEPVIVGGASLYLGDCLESLRGMADCSVDSVVCDPPYGLSFMGKKWDYDVPGEAIWSECLRVLKPGGHLLAFAGTRTQHRMAVRIEDAGFEIRDMIAWVYSQGFPKSMDVSKAIDKAGGSSPREQSAMLRTKREAVGLTRDRVAAFVGCTPSSVRDWEEGRARATGAPIEFIVPSEDYRAKLADLLGYSSDERRLMGVAADRRGDGTVYGVGHSGDLRTGGHTETARQWQGWGTALKPSLEPITVARKPLIGTVAENVLAHGTGALNIDGCRVATDENLNGGRYSDNKQGDAGNCYGSGINERSANDYVQPTGRWPANLIHSGEDDVLAAFPQAPRRMANASTTAPSPKTGNVYRKMRREGEPSANSDNEGAVGFKMKPGMRRLDAGSAARFYYAAKASKSDRGAENTHPTVKPTDLMRYLCRLVTPPGGVVLDPFMGSGSTGKAAVLEGFRFIGCELSAEYLAIAEARIRAAQPKPASPAPAEPQLGLFGT